MKKLFIVFLSVALSVILVNTAFGNAEPQKPQPVAVVKTEVDTPLCYLQTSDGKTLNLDKLCKKVPERAVGVAIVDPYNNAAIKKFDDELYGKGN